MELERAEISSCSGRLTACDYMLEIEVRSSDVSELQKIKSELIHIIRKLE